MAFHREKMNPHVNDGRDPALPRLNPFIQRERDTKFDTSSLRAGGHMRVVHRDYAAHWFRWGFAYRFVRSDDAVLDIGCGRDQMLAWALIRSAATRPARYVGVDVGTIPKKCGVAWATVLDEFDFTARWRELKGRGPFDVVTCFEVIEHMPKPEGRKLLRAARELLAPDGVFLLSTPVYNERHMAANHVHEYRYDELEQEIHRAGLAVERVHGTFMTVAAIKRAATEAERALIAELSAFYAWDVLANFLAPKYPRAASNCCWVLRRAA